MCIFAQQLITSIVGSAQHALHLSIHLAVEQREHHIHQKLVERLLFLLCHPLLAGYYVVGQGSYVGTEFGKCRRQLSTLYARTIILSCLLWKFLTFPIQVEHNASLFQYVLQRWHVATMLCKGTQKKLQLSQLLMLYRCVFR